MSTVTTATLVTSSGAESSGFSDCPVCVIVWLFLKKFAPVIIAVVVTLCLAVIIGLILFCCYRRKVRQRTWLHRETANARGDVDVNGRLTTRKSYDNDYHIPPRDSQIYDDPDALGLPSSIQALGIPQPPDVIHSSTAIKDPNDISTPPFTDTQNGPSGIIVPQRDPHRLNPASDDSYLTPTSFEQPADHNPYNIPPEDKTDGTEVHRDSVYLHPTSDTNGDQPSNPDGVNTPIWHTGGVKPNDDYSTWISDVHVYDNGSSANPV